VRGVRSAKTRFPRHYTVQFSLVALAVLLTLQGGGILTFAVRSDSGWYWENSTSQALGSGLKRIATPFIFGAKNRGRAA
jgi:hypothetical protein